MIAILLRCIIVYLLLLLCLKLTGKRQIGELDVSELITTLLLSEIASHPITDVTAPLINSIIPIFAISCIEVIMTYLTSRLPGLRSVLYGRAGVIIKDGIPNQKEMSKQRIGATELMAQLRLQGVGNIKEVSYAILEEDGQMSVFTDTDLAYVLIADGKINRFGTTHSEFSEQDVNRLLAKKNRKVREVFLMTALKDKVNIIYKDEN